MNCESAPSLTTIEDGIDHSDGTTTFSRTYEMSVPQAGDKNRYLVIRLPLLKKPPTDIVFHLHAYPNTPPLVNIYSIKINNNPNGQPPYTQINFDAELPSGSKVGSDARYCLEYTIIGRKA